MLRNGLEPWHVLVTVAVLVLLFGSKKLPDMARGLGKSMRILKSETAALREEAAPPGGAPAGEGQSGSTPSGGTLPGGAASGTGRSGTAPSGGGGPSGGGPAEPARHP
ncbi:Sec-independent protein translocase subunit TatA [Kitasatospora sp. NPDC057738]|uniref:Sec-independent protein translocase subunit TatA n=1 Tax=Kitasatospora sp. NPDC057738 TaxID=3346233 RepID=UPI00368BB3A0